MAAEKWLMFVVDSSTAMGPHWPTIFSKYIEKIVRYSCSRWREPEASCAKVEFGLIMYNVKSDVLECRVQCSHWTRNEDQFLEKLSTLTFNGSGNKYKSFMSEGLAEALVMFPKPPLGNPSREYFNGGERHCIIVPAIQPSPMFLALHVPKIRGNKLHGSHTDYRVADYKDVAQFYGPLGVSLSVISPKQNPAWREIFQLGAGIAGAAPRSVSNNENDHFTVLISEKFREAHAALAPQEIVVTSSLQNAKPKQAAIVPNSSDCDLTGQEFKLLRRESNPNNSKQNKNAEAMDRNQQRPEKENIPEIITISSDSETSADNPDPLLPRDKMEEFTTSHQNTPATQISAEAAPADPKDATFPESGNNDAIEPQYIPEDWITFEEDILDAYYSQPSHCINLSDTIIGDYDLGGEQDLSVTHPTGVESQNIQPISQSCFAASTPNNNACEGEYSSRLAEPEAPKEVQESRAINPIPIQRKHNYTSCNCAATAFLAQDILGSQPLEGQSTSDIMTAVARSLGFNIGRKAQNTSGVASASQASSRKRKSCSNSRKGKEGILRGSRNKRTLTSALCPPSPPLPQVAVGESALVAGTGITQITHGPNDLELLPSPMQNEQSYVNTWEGVISTSDRGNLIFLSKAKAYRKITAHPTLTAMWPQWLEIGCVIAHSAVDATSIFRGPIDYLIFELLNSNDNQLFQILSSNDLCARLDLPLQTLILTPTSEPCRFIGTLYQGGFTVRMPTIASSSSQEHPKQPQQEAERSAKRATGFPTGC